MAFRMKLNYQNWDTVPEVKVTNNVEHLRRVPADSVSHSKPIEEESSIQAMAKRLREEMRNDTVSEPIQALPVIEPEPYVQAPQTIPIKGDKGERGEKGEKGDPGVRGEKGEPGTSGGKKYILHSNNTVLEKDWKDILVFPNKGKLDTITLILKTEDETEFRLVNYADSKEYCSLTVDSTGVVMCEWNPTNLPRLACSLNLQGKASNNGKTRDNCFISTELEFS